MQRAQETLGGGGLWAGLSHVIEQRLRYYHKPSETFIYLAMS